MRRWARRVSQFVLMGAIPARVAGVREVIVCSPPGPDGLPSPVVLAAAALANVDRVFAVGGAGAIAAMALGTSTVPRVDRIVGPGNAYVAEAKLQLGRAASPSTRRPGRASCSCWQTTAAITMASRARCSPRLNTTPTPRSLAVICGESADANAASVDAALDALVRATPRAEIVRRALAARGGIVTAAIRSARRRHRQRVGRASTCCCSWAAMRAKRHWRRCRVSGTVFVGASSSVAFGDYMTGANHVLPTAGAARSYSGLSTLDFVRWTTWQDVTPAAAASLANDVGVFADAEALPAHAAAARAWSRNTAERAS